MKIGSITPKTMFRPLVYQVFKFSKEMYESRTPHFLFGTPLSYKLGYLKTPPFLFICDPTLPSFIQHLRVSFILPRKNTHTRTHTQTTTTLSSYPRTGALLPGSLLECRTYKLSHFISIPSIYLRILV